MMILSAHFCQTPTDVQPYGVPGRDPHGHRGRPSVPDGSVWLLDGPGQAGPGVVGSRAFIAASVLG
jgi:hypothetical protein